MPHTIEPTPPQAQPRRSSTSRSNLSALGKFFAGYAWLIVKNLIGWAFIFASPFLGFTLPGPGGIPLFLIGFALITFPGKRKLTARVLRGQQMDLNAHAFNVVEIVASLLVPLVVAWPLAVKWWPQQKLSLSAAWYVAVCMCAIASTWIITRFTLRGLNLLIRVMPTVRRKVRPWLGKHGIVLLPPRYRTRRRGRGGKLARPSAAHGDINDEIIQIDQRHLTRFKKIWLYVRPWLRRALGVAITIWIFAIMIRPLPDHWAAVQSQIVRINWWQFAVSCAIFAAFLFLFRAMTWRKVLKGFGYRLPYAAATRIWSTSELARYLPGAIWQVVGRVYLIKPYGVSAIVCSTSQILELCMFVFANVLLAGACLLWFAARIAPEARPWLFTALALVPALAVLLHPKIFYGITNFALSKFLARPPIVTRLRGKKLIELLAWVMLGLFVQTAAVYLIAQPVLNLKLAWWWVIAGSYCLAWTAGFFAFWAPAGIGVRELVFAVTVQVIIPPHARETLPTDPATFAATVYLLGFLLRLWTMIGELIVWLASSAIDYRGAMNRADAPGRTTQGRTTHAGV